MVMAVGTSRGPDEGVTEERIGSKGLHVGSGVYAPSRRGAHSATYAASLDVTPLPMGAQTGSQIPSSPASQTSHVGVHNVQPGNGSRTSLVHSLKPRSESD